MGHHASLRSRWTERLLAHGFSELSGRRRASRLLDERRRLGVSRDHPLPAPVEGARFRVIGWERRVPARVAPGCRGSTMPRPTPSRASDSGRQGDAEQTDSTHRRWRRSRVRRRRHGGRARPASRGVSKDGKSGRFATLRLTSRESRATLTNPASRPLGEKDLSNAPMAGKSRTVDDLARLEGRAAFAAVGLDGTQSCRDQSMPRDERSTPCQ